MTDTLDGAPSKRRRGAPKNWRDTFLTALAETSNVRAAAENAGISPAWVYKTRREDPEFARRWLAALCEGYDHLEMELLGYLRDPDPARKMPARKMDVTAGLRLLAMHRQTVTRERALEDTRSEQEVLDSIDAFIDRMRENTAANLKLLEGPAEYRDDIA